MKTIKKIISVEPIDKTSMNSPIVEDQKLSIIDLHDSDSYFNGQKYPNGSFILKLSELLQCSYGSWINQNKSTNS
jgi:hypothetical protein